MVTAYSYVATKYYLKSVKYVSTVHNSIIIAYQLVKMTTTATETRL